MKTTQSEQQKEKKQSSSKKEVKNKFDRFMDEKFPNLKEIVIQA